MSRELEGGAEAPSDTPAVVAGGVGLYDQGVRDPFPAWAGWAVGLVALALVVGLGYTLYAFNPAFAKGTAGGTGTQIGAQAASTGPEIAAGSPAAEGRQLIAQKGCGGCHTIPGVQGANGNVGPNLGGVAGRTKIAGGAVANGGPDDLKKWIVDPPSLKPGTAMPKLGLTDDEATKIVAYLETLK